jgi:ribonuclease D
MILGHDTLVRLAARRPHDPTEMLEVPGCTHKVVHRVGALVIEAVERAEALPAEALPERPRGTRPGVPSAVRRRSEALRAWRGEAARGLGLDPGFLLPQRLIDRLAAEAPMDIDALARVDGMRRWRIELIGREVLARLGRG